MARDTYDSGLLEPGGPDPAADMLRRNEGLILSPKWDVNHQRVGYGSDTTTDASGRVSEVTPATRITPADANRDLTRREYETQAGIINSIGPDAWFRLTPEAQAALTDIAYNYGSLDKLPSVIKAAQTGDPSHLAQTIAARSVDNRGVNRRRRLDEARIIMAGGEGESEQPPDPTAGLSAKKGSWDWPEAKAKDVSAPDKKAAGGSWDWPTPGEQQSPGLWERFMQLATRGLPPEEAKMVRQMIESSPTSQLAGAAAEVPALATRAAGWLPNEYGGKQAVEATKALEGVGGKEGHVVGEFAAPFLFPWGRAAEGLGAGAGALGRAVGLTGKAAETAEAAAPAAEAAKDVPLLKRMGSGALSAAPGGALWGGTQFGGT